MRTRHRTRTSRSLVLAAATALLVAACGDADGTIESEPTHVASSDAAAGDAPVVRPEQQATTSAATTTTTLPGEPFEGWPNPGDELAVVGVRYDETLPVRGGPGSASTEIASLGPTDTGVAATGEARLLAGDSVYYEVTVGGVNGWADGRNLKYLGPTGDVTAAITAELGGAPSAATMLELGAIVADAVAPDDPEGTPRIVVVVAPTEGATGTVTYDVLGFADDSVIGARLAVTGTTQLVPTAFRAGGYQLVSVDQTDLCERGGSPTTACL